MGRMTLEGELTLDGAGWDRTLDQAEERAAHFAEETLGELKAAFIGAFAIDKIQEAIRSAIEFGEEIKHTADRLGVSTTAAQEFSYAARQSGADLEQTARGLDRLAKALTSIEEGSKDAEKMEHAFSRLGISIDEIKGKSPEEVFKLMGEKMEGLQVTAGVTTSMIELFGRSGAKLIPVLQELAENTQKAHDLGLVMSPEEIKILDEAGNRMKTLVVYTKEAGAGLVVLASEGTKALLEVAKVALGMSTAVEEAVDKQQKLRIASMQKTLESIQEINAELKARAQTGADPAAARTKEEEKEIGDVQKRLDEDTNRRREARRSKDELGDGTPTPERLNAVAEKLRELEKEYQRLKDAGQGGSLSASDIANQIEKLKDLNDKLQSKAAEARQKAVDDATKPGKAPKIPTDSLIGIGNFLGESGRNIPGIQERLIQSNDRLAKAIDKLASKLHVTPQQAGSMLGLDVAGV